MAAESLEEITELREKDAEQGQKAELDKQTAELARLLQIIAV
jgi:hypothetical protein